MADLSESMRRQKALLSGQRGEQQASPKKKARARKALDGAGRAAKEGAEMEGKDGSKRRCVSTACIACRKRKSKCDGNTPACAACESVYGTECVYDPNSDHRRKGVYKEKLNSTKTANSILQTLIQAILNATDDEVPRLVKQIRTCESLDDVAARILRQEDEEDDEDSSDLLDLDSTTTAQPTFETELSGKMGELRLENGQVRFIGGTSNLLYLTPENAELDGASGNLQNFQQQEAPLTTWTTVTDDTELVVHLINMYFTWHYPYFTTLSKSLFYRDFLLGKPLDQPRRTTYCSSLLVNAMLALGCHFTSSPQACSDPSDPATKGDAFFQEAKRLIVENDEYEKPKLTTVQALALMSVREAGCGREAKGWVYSGMSFRMAQDMGLNLDSGGMTASKEGLDEQEIDARRITFWGCFLFDKCWSNYLGRLPQLPLSNITVPKYDVFPDEDSDIWSPYFDKGISTAHSQASRTRTIALQISALCEISSDLLIFFYHPQTREKHVGKATEVKKLSELHTKLETWRRELPKELEPREGQLPNVLLMHMFFHLLYIHLFRPFLRYNPSTSPLPSNVSPRKLCTQGAAAISKMMRLYKRTYGLRQICNIAVYMEHSACTIHLLNLPEKTAKRDIVHGVKHLEEIAEDWLCARRTLSILSVLARKWGIGLPEEAGRGLESADKKWGAFGVGDVPSPGKEGTPTSSSTATIVGEKSTSAAAAAASNNPTAAPGLFMKVEQMTPQASQQGQLQSQLGPNFNKRLYSDFTPLAPPARTSRPSHTPNNSVNLDSSYRQHQSHHSGSSQVNSASSHDLQNTMPAPTAPPQTQQNQQNQQETDDYTFSGPRRRASTAMSLPPDNATQMAALYASRHNYVHSNSVGQQQGQQGINLASGSSSTTSYRQVSPSTMFGGVEALMESQDWWLRDQASLAMGFENWDGLGEGMGASPEMGSGAGMEWLGLGSGFGG